MKQNVINKTKLKPDEFEAKWQKKWEEEGIYQPDVRNSKRPFYNLMMFPYPSAEGLHVGNVYAFTGVDIYGRFKRMQGFDVFEPIGLDGFGIHSENYAIKIGKHPVEQAKISEANFYRQLRSIGNGFAWKNKLETYDPDYYKWTQWIFVQMFKHGLAYRKSSPVNFCPSCKTVLSDEQVIDGRCERCKTLVEKRQMEQWFFKITDYAERLLQNTYKSDFHWTEKVKIGQRNWIGKKEGININYPIIPASPAGGQLSNQRISNNIGAITCFTTRPDTNFGATFIVIGPEHPLVASLLKTDEIKNYVETTKKKSEIERIAEGRKKTGVFTHLFAVNQLTNYKMPIYISDFVLGNVGTGAVVGVPGHDSRDFEFAREFKLPIKRVVVGKDGDTSEITREQQVQEEEGVMVNSGFLNGCEINEAIKKMMDYIEEKGWGKRVTTYKLRDWCISRQRYWGSPIPMIYCEKCNWVPVPEEDLPVLLPDLDDWKPEGTGKGPLAKLPDFVRTKCPQCGGDGKRETDVCDTFLDSAWYFLRYPSVNSQQKKKSHLPWDEKITNKWLPVASYIGGAEHTVLHLLYSRFITMALHDFGYLDFSAKGGEPYKRFYAHGLIIAEGAKMSKSRGNVIIPDEYIRKYGADTLRIYLMFLGPFSQGGDFRDTGIAGMYRFLSRVWRLVQEFQISNFKFQISGEINRKMHKVIKEVTEDIENLRYNTAIAHIMEYVNDISNVNLPAGGHISNIPKEVIETLLLLLAPFAPHMTEELYQNVKFQMSNDKSKDDFKSIHVQPWPEYDGKYLVEEMVTVVVQVNGKVREIINVKFQMSNVKSKVEEMAKKSEKVKKYLEGKKIVKTIYVPGKIINFVVA